MLSVEQLVCAFDGRTILHGIDLQVAQGGIMCLLGPSGCGKTTLLRVIAGLEQAQQGDVKIEGQSILPVPVHQRGFGLMFQEFALFPHMNVAENVAFGLKMQGVANPAERVSEVLTLVGLGGFEKRDVAQLSGGERQRVALARSLAPNPRLLMLDEPLGALDASLREYLVVELREIIKRLGLTAVYVTHDQQEAFAIADHIAVMNAGRIEQNAAPEVIYQRPETAFVARFMGLNNIVPVTGQRDGLVITPLGDFPVSAPAQAVLLHPAGMRLADGEDGIIGTLEERVFLGDAYRVVVRPVVAPELALSFKVAVGADLPQQGARVSVMADQVVPLRA
jgi:thiamine transport system ATP-binding protein